MTQEDLKVTDKRMFTPDGRLREEFQHLEDAEGTPAEAASQSGAAAAVEAGARPPGPLEAPAAPSGPIIPDAAPEARPEPAVAAPDAPRERATQAAEPPASGELSILDLVGLLAEHTALYLGEASLPDGKSVRDLRAAKLHLDLLDVLKAKTAGNLTTQEQAVLDDILYRLRMLYVEKQRQE